MLTAIIWSTIGFLMFIAVLAYFEDNLVRLHRRVR